MSIETVDTLIVGAGQAGLAMSEHLSRRGVPHLVLERHRIAERWRSERWDSLVANGPAWHDRFPDAEFADTDADAFATKDEVANYLVAYAERTGAPVRDGVEVRSVTRHAGRPGFRVETSDGPVEARRVVAATGAFQRPVVPDIVPEGAGPVQIHSSGYRNPGQLPDGGVLVVGCGSSGAQIADELQRSGRRVHLSVGPHERPPRSYRGLDFCWWLGVLGHWDAVARAPGTEHVTIAVSGARGGTTIDFRRMAEAGTVLVGRTEAWRDGTLSFAPDLARNLAHGDASLLAMLDQADAHAVADGLDLPDDPEARRIPPDPACVREPVRELDLGAAGIRSIVWATGFAADWSWLRVDAFDGSGRPEHQRGVSTEPGIYFLGLPWQSRRGSSFIWGVWHDAAFVAEHIATQRGYLEYRAARHRTGAHPTT